MLRFSLLSFAALTAFHAPTCGGGLIAREPEEVTSSPAPDAQAGSGGSSGISPPATGGGSPVGLVALATNQTCPWGMALDATSVYWTDCGDPTGGFVLKVPKAGGTITTLAKGPAAVSGVAVAGASVYWMAGAPGGDGFGSLMMVPTGGGASTTLVANAYGPSHVVADDTSVYWIDGGAIMSVPPGPAVPPPREVVAASSSPSTPQVSIGWPTGS
jgi:hypothetical protein